MASRAAASTLPGLCIAFVKVLSGNVAYFAPHPKREICDTIKKERIIDFVIGFMVGLQILIQSYRVRIIVDRSKMPNINTEKLS